MNVKTEIENYIAAVESNGALLITGSWGCGKTFLIKETMGEFNSENKFLLSMISLFGVDSIESLHRIIKENVFFSRGFNENSEEAKKWLLKFKDKVKPIVEAFSESSKIAKGISTALNFNWQDLFNVEANIQCIYNGEMITKKLVLIFDDFERSKIDKIDLLGVINDYCENKGIKVIIIADEERLKDEKYKEFKEKVVGRTVKLIPNAKSIIQSIMRQYKETEPGYYNFINRNVELILQTFFESKSDNFRSLKSLLFDFERVYIVWKNSQISMSYIPKVFYDFAAMLFTVKSGEYKEGKYGDLFIDNSIKDKFSNWDGIHKLNSLKNWIVNGIWDEEGVLYEITEKYALDNLTDEQKFLKFDFWDLNETIIENGLPIAIGNAYSGKLNRDEIYCLLEKIYAMDKYSIKMPCSIDYNKINYGFEQRKNQIKKGVLNESRLYKHIMKEQVVPEALELYKNLEKYDNDLIVIKNKIAVMKYFSLDANVSEYNLRGLVVGALDDELLEAFWIKFTHSGNADMRDVARVILNLNYKDKYYISKCEMEKTIGAFKKLKKRLDDYKTILTDKITMLIVNQTIKEIDSIIDEVKHVVSEN